MPCTLAPLLAAIDTANAPTPLPQSITRSPLPIRSTKKSW
jgi:hypothetical protein